MPSHTMQESLIERLKGTGIPDQLIEAVAESGYFLRAWQSVGPEPHFSVSDPFYGNKALSSSFEFDEFVDYICGNRTPQLAPPLRRYRVKSLEEIRQVLVEEPRPRYLEEGSHRQSARSRERCRKCGNCKAESDR